MPCNLSSNLRFFHRHAAPSSNFVRCRLARVPAFRGHVAPGTRLLLASEVRHRHPHVARHLPCRGRGDVYRSYPHEIGQKTKAEGVLSDPDFARVLLLLSPLLVFYSEQPSSLRLFWCVAAIFSTSWWCGAAPRGNRFHLLTSTPRKKRSAGPRSCVGIAVFATV